MNHIIAMAVIGVFCIGMTLLARAWIKDGERLLASGQGDTRERINAVLDLALLRLQFALFLIMDAVMVLLTALAVLDQVLGWGWTKK